MKTDAPRRSSALLGAALALALAAACGGKPPAPAPPAANPLPAGSFLAEISAAAPSSMPVGITLSIPVKVRNLSPSPWATRGNPKTGAMNVNASYHWFRPDGSRAVWEGNRTPLPPTVAPGEEVTVQTSIKAPEAPGEYVLEIDLVQEGVTWFKEKGTKPLKASVKVE